jgi:hypothetical protein
MDVVVVVVVVDVAGAGGYDSVSFPLMLKMRMCDWGGCELMGWRPLKKHQTGAG